MFCSVLFSLARHVRGRAPGLGLHLATLPSAPPVRPPTSGGATAGRRGDDGGGVEDDPGLGPGRRFGAASPRLLPKAPRVLPSGTSGESPGGPPIRALRRSGLCRLELPRQAEGWGGPSAAAFSQWLVERLLADEDIIIVECTPRFDVDLGLRRSLGHKYDVHPLVFSPDDLGFPLRRQRLYALLLRRGRVSAAPGQDMRELFWSLFPRQPLLPGCAFFRAPDESIDALRYHMAATRRLAPTQVDGSPWPFQALLPRGLEQHKRIHRRLVQPPRGGPPDATTSGAQPDLEERRPARKRKASGEQTWGSQADSHHQLCVDIAHAPPFASPSRELPVLCRNSVVWSFGHRRPMLGTEKWEAMGLPVWSTECSFPHPWKTLFPGMAMSRRAPTLSNHALGTLAGNSMHLGAVGAVLLWALGCTTSEADGRGCGAQPAEKPPQAACTLEEDGEAALSADA